LSVTGSIGDTSFFGMSSSIFDVTVVVVVVVVVSIFSASQTPFCTILLVAFVVELTLELTFAGTVDLPPGLVIGGGFFVGEVTELAEAADCFCTSDTRLVAVLVLVTDETRDLVAVVVPVVRAEEICLLAVSLICLSIIGDLDAAVEPTLDLAVALNAEVGAVFGLLAVELLVEVLSREAAGFGAVVEAEVGRGAFGVLVVAEPVLVRVLVAVLTRPLEVFDATDGLLAGFEVAVLVAGFTSPLVRGFLSVDVELTLEATVLVGGFGFKPMVLVRGVALGAVLAGALGVLAVLVAAVLVLLNVLVAVLAAAVPVAGFRGAAAVEVGFFAAVVVLLTFEPTLEVAADLEPTLDVAVGLADLAVATAAAAAVVATAAAATAAATGAAAVLAVL
jgi:hypothetical protein